MGKITRNRPCFMGKSAENLKICHEKMGKLDSGRFSLKKNGKIPWFPADVPIH